MGEFFFRSESTSKGTLRLLLILGGGGRGGFTRGIVAICSDDE